MGAVTTVLLVQETGPRVRPPLGVSVPTEVSIGSWNVNETWGVLSGTWLAPSTGLAAVTRGGCPSLTVKLKVVADGSGLPATSTKLATVTVSRVRTGSPWGNENVALRRVASQCSGRAITVPLFGRPVAGCRLSRP